MRNVGHALRGMPLLKAIRYLEDVLEHKQAIPFLRYSGGMGRHAQGKLRNVAGDKCAWPEKATKVFLGLLNNAKANAEANKPPLDPEDLVVTHVQSNQAPCMRRRTYRAHGRINAYMSCPSHVEVNIYIYIYIYVYLKYPKFIIFIILYKLLDHYLH